MSTQKEKPIIFNTQMIQAILDSRKTMTRRVIKPQPEGADYWTVHKEPWYKKEIFFPNKDYAKPPLLKCPYGKIGDRLWVRETHMVYNSPEFKSLEEDMLREDLIFYKATDAFRVYRGEKWKPSIHMFRRHSRINLEITDIRVERVKDISLKDIEAEGIKDKRETNNAIGQQTKFRALWDDINFKKGYGWEVNPWVFVISFKRI